MLKVLGCKLTVCSHFHTCSKVPNFSTIVTTCWCMWESKFPTQLDWILNGSYPADHLPQNCRCNFWFSCENSASNIWWIHSHRVSTMCASCVTLTSCLKTALVTLAHSELSERVHLLKLIINSFSEILHFTDSTSTGNIHDINKVFSPKELPLIGDFLFFIPLFVNPWSAVFEGLPEPT